MAEDVENLCDRAETEPERVLSSLDEYLRLAGPSQPDAAQVAVCDALTDAHIAVQSSEYSSLSAAAFGDHLTALRAMVRAIDCQDDWGPTNTQVVVRLFNTILGLGRAHLEAFRPHSAVVSNLLGECLHLLKPAHQEPNRRAMADIMYSIHYPGDSPSLLAVPVFREYRDQVRDVLKAIDQDNQGGSVHASVISGLLALLGEVAADDPAAMCALAVDYQHLIVA